MKKILWVAILAFLSIGPHLIANPLSELVPDNALGVVEWLKPQKTLADVRSFLLPLKDAEGKSLAEAFDQAMKESKFPLASANADQPWGVAMLQGEHKAPGVLICFPVNNAGKDVPKLQDFGKSMAFKAATWKNYVVLYSGLKNPPVFPAKGTFDFTKIDDLSSVGTSVYLNLKEIKKNFLPGKTFSQLLNETFEKDDTMSAQEKKGAKAVVQAVGEAFDQLLGLGTSLTANAEGATLTFRSDFEKNKSFQKLIAGLAGDTKGTQAFAKYLSTDALMSGVSNFAPSKIEALSLAYTQSILSMFGLTDADYKSFADHLKAHNALMGTRAAFNLDVDFDNDKIQALMKDKDDNFELLKDAFDLRIFGAYETKDGMALQKQDQDYYASPAFTNFVNKILKKLDAPIKLTFQSQNLKDQNFAYSTLQFKVEVIPGGTGKDAVDDEKAQKINKVLGPLLNQLTLYSVYGKNIVYYSVGKNGLAQLKSLVAKDAVDNSWASAGQAWTKNVGDDSLGTFSVSMSRLMSLIKKAKIEGMESLPDDWGTGPGLVFGTKIVQGGNIEFSAFIGIKVVQAIVDGINAMEAAKAKDGAETAPPDSSDNGDAP